MHAKKVTPAAIRVVDVPGTGAQLLGGLRQVDALLAVVDGFSPDADPPSDLETLKLELLVADRDHVERRLERVAKQAKSGDQKLKAEVAELEKLLAHLEGGATLAEYPGELPPELEPLTTKPLLAVENGPGGIDCKLEAELAELPDEDAAAFREGRPVGAPRGRAAALRGARPDHVLHRGREGDARVDAAARARPRWMRRRRSTRTSRAASSAAR